MNMYEYWNSERRKKDPWGYAGDLFLGSLPIIGALAMIWIIGSSIFRALT